MPPQTRDYRGKCLRYSNLAGTEKTGSCTILHRHQPPMGKLKVLFVIGFLCAAPGCSPRQFLTRRLAFELIANSDAFKATQRFWLRTGIVSNKDYISPEYLVLQRRGWLTGSTANCPSE